jgi:hypothetical protein
MLLHKRRDLFTMKLHQYKCFCKDFFVKNSQDSSKSSQVPTVREFAVELVNGGNFWNCLKLWDVPFYAHLSTFQWYCVYISV